MEELFNWYSTELPPLLQVVFGMFISLGVFKLMTFIVDVYQKRKKSED